MSQTLSQRRAAAALEAVYALRDEPGPEKLKGRFRAYAQSIPAMVQMNGLGQTAAFCRSRTGDDPPSRAYRRLYDVLSRWLTSPGQPYDEGKDLLDALTRGDMTLYRAAQAEALAYLDWIKRFSAAFLPKERVESGVDSESGAATDAAEVTP